MKLLNLLQTERGLKRIKQGDAVLVALFLMLFTELVSDHLGGEGWNAMSVTKCEAHRRYVLVSVPTSNGNTIWPWFVMSTMLASHSSCSLRH